MPAGTVTRRESHGKDFFMNSTPSRALLTATKVIVLATSLVMTTVDSANAALGAPYFTESCLLNGGTDGAKELVGAGACDLVKGAAHISASTSFAGFATAIADGTLTGFNIARASINYQFSVSGPVGGIYVPVFVVTEMHVRVSASFGAIASLEVLSSDERDYLGQILDTRDVGPVADFSGPLPFLARSGIVNTVSMDALVSASSHSPISGHAEAFVDPYIYIDPAFLAGHPGYSVSVSSGFPNVSPPLPVPEPESWALFALGFGMLSGRVASRRIRSAGRPLLP